jgi:DNA-binding response OmpR family regulator
MGMNLRPDEAPAGATAISPSANEPPPQVLVVEDTAAVRALLVALLQYRGYRVIEAEDGLAAQIILTTERPSLVISDLDMPVCDGWELLAHCHARHPGLPVLLMSGRGLGRRPEIEQWAAGALSKPFAIEQLHAEIQRLMRRAA